MNQPVNKYLEIRTVLKYLIKIVKISKVPLHQSKKTQEHRCLIRSQKTKWQTAIHNSYSKMESFIKVKKKMEKGMDGVDKHSKMVLAIKVCGKTMSLMEEEFSFRKMAADMKDNSKIS